MRTEEAVHLLEICADTTELQVEALLFPLGKLVNVRRQSSLVLPELKSGALLDHCHGLDDPSAGLPSLHSLQLYTLSRTRDGSFAAPPSSSLSAGPFDILSNGLPTSLRSSPHISLL